MKLIPVVIVAACFVAHEPSAHAENDGVYGRFDGDLDLSAALGTQLAEGAPSAVVGARALFLSTVGAYARLTEAFREASPAPRTLGFGAAFRPFFIPRWALDLEHGPPVLDLALDATTFDLGALWVSDAARGLSDRPGFEVALGTEIPLVGTAAGPWIGVRGALRWRGPELGSANESRLGPAIALTLAWHFVQETHLVDYRDRSRP